MRRSIATFAATSVLAATALVTGLAGGIAPAGAATVPSGFTDVAVATVNAPTGIEVLGDGRVVILDQNGRIRIHRDGPGLVPTPALTLTVCGGAGSEMGLLGFTSANDFATTGHVFVYATRPVTGGCVNRVSRFTMTGDVIDPASELVLLEAPGTLTESATNHNGGDLEMGQDGYLYVAVGDSGSDPRNDSGGGGGNDAARDMSILSGKILRITPSGGIPADNPYIGSGTTRCATAGTSTPTTATCQEIFASGLRNPYRFAFDPNAGVTRFFVNDVGQSTREEVNEGAKGADYGWNVREGQCPRGQNPPCAAPPAGLTDPITDYPRSVGTYITAGAFVPNGVWPAEYDGAYLFADGGTGKIFVRLADGSVDYSTPFASNLGELADMVFVPEGDGYALYYTQNSGNSVRKITYTASATAPTVSGLRLQPVAPTRVYDTRNGIGTSAGLVRAATSRVIDVQRPSSDVQAVLANVTFAGAEGLGFAQAWPPRTKRPSTSVINASSGGEVVANTVVLPLGADGTIVVSTSVTTHLLVDVLGYFTAAAGNGGEYRSLDPARLIDSRQPAGTALGSGSGNPFTVVGDRIDVQVTGKLGVPADGTAGAVAFILTAIGDATGPDGYATAYPAGASRPDASNVNTSGPSDIRANLVVVPVGTDGKVSLYGFRTQDLLIDVAGWFTAASVPAAGTGRLTVTPSQRVVDTRQSPPVGFAALAAGGTGTLDVTPPLPGTATAVVQNLTVPGSTGWGFVTAVPGGTSSEVSNLNLTGPGQTRAALAITDVPASGQVQYRTFAATPLVVDVYGWFD